jgi:hypothetical protein
MTPKERLAKAKELLSKPTEAKKLKDILNDRIRMQKEQDKAEALEDEWAWKKAHELPY